MNIQNVKDLVTSKAARSILVGKKHSPLVLTVAGITGLVGAGVLAARSTLKLEIALTEFNSNRELVRLARASSTEEEFSKQQHAQMLGAVYGKGAFDLVKLYGPSVTLATASIVAIMSGHNILSKRNAAIAAAYKTVESAFSRYRDRVEEEFGPEVAHRIKHGIKSDKILTLDDNNKQVEEEIQLVDPNGLSQYSRFFDETNANWQRDADYNKTFVLQTQRFMNDKFRAQGHLFLNEVYDALGFERTKEGAVVGWVYDKAGSGDNFIDFGLFDVANANGTDAQRRAFINGLERSILLDFNVDGVIWDLI